MPEEPRGCCRCCCSFIFTLGLTSLFMWLSLRTSNPKCSVNYFYLPALNKSLDNRDNNTLYFQLKLANPNKDKGIYYDPVNVTISNISNSSKNVGNYSVPKFYQGHKKTAKKSGNVTVNKQLLSQAVFENGSALFRVDLVTAVRFKIVAWQTKRHRIAVGADVWVNDQGAKANKKDVKLKSQAPMDVRFCVVVNVLLNFLVFILLNF